MLKHLRFCFTLFLALSLHLTNAWAMAVPCAHMAGSPAQSGVLAAKAQPESTTPCHEKQQRSQQSPGAGSGGCAHCHLACSPALLASATGPAGAAHAVEYAHTPCAVTLFIPRLPLPPPVA